MSGSTAIEWTDATWNPVTGCDRISSGCDNCYALAMAKRLKAMGQARYQLDGDPSTSGPGFGVTTHPDVLEEPLKWRKPRRVFVNSMGDLFHARVPREFVAKVFAVMACAPQHTFQVLTKRPERMARILGDPAFQDDVACGSRISGFEWPMPNVWIGTTIEHADHLGRVDSLRATPATLRFISVEPMLSPFPYLDLDGIGWVICGGESGPNARPMHPGWVRSLRDQCVSARVPFLFKQWGEWCHLEQLSDDSWERLDPSISMEQGHPYPRRVGRKLAGRELDGRIWDEYPPGDDPECE